MKVLLRERDLSDDYIRLVQQIGADGVDIHNWKNVPGFVEQGYPDLHRLVQLREKLRAAGLDVYRVAPPTPRRFLLGEPGGEQEVDNLGKTIEIFGQAGIPFMSMPLHLGVNPGYQGGYQHVHRGGYTMHGFDKTLMKQRLAEAPPAPFSLEQHWARSVQIYQQLVPLAEKYGVRLLLHPSDPPLPDTEFSPRRWAGILDAVPSEQSGLLYCIGTRYEAGVNIFDDIRHFGRKGKIFHTHCRNVRGSIPTAGGYQEVALDDGDMNMFRVIKTLQEVGFDGGLQIDHLPRYTVDTPDQKSASAYAVGYLKALLAALQVWPTPFPWPAV